MGGLAFITAVQYFTVASAVCKWYFSHDSNSELDSDAVGFPVFNGLKRAHRYHMGSLAFGSFILAMTWMVRLVVAIMTAALETNAKKDPSGAAAKTAKCAMKCCNCCLKCWNNCLKFLTEKAYIRIALTGESFCAAAKSSYSTVMANPGR